MDEILWWYRKYESWNDAIQLISTNSQPTYTGPALDKFQKVLSVINDRWNENGEIRLILSENYDQDRARCPRINRHCASSDSAIYSSDSDSSTDFDSDSSTAEDSNDDDNTDDSDSIDATNTINNNDDDRNDDADPPTVKSHVLYC